MESLITPGNEEHVGIRKVRLLSWITTIIQNPCVCMRVFVCMFVFTLVHIMCLGNFLFWRINFLGSIYITKALTCGVCPYCPYFRQWRSNLILNLGLNWVLQTIIIQHAMKRIALDSLFWSDSLCVVLAKFDLSSLVLLPLPQAHIMLYKK